MYDILQKLYCTPTIVKLMKLLTFYSLQASIHTHTHTTAAVNTKNEM